MIIKNTHILLLVLVAALLYYIMGECSCKESYVNKYRIFNNAGHMGAPGTGSGSDLCNTLKVPQNLFNSKNNSNNIYNKLTEGGFKDGKCPEKYKVKIRDFFPVEGRPYPWCENCLINIMRLP